MKLKKKEKKKTMLEVAHEIAKDLHEVDVIDATRMQEFDALCSPVKNSSSEKARSACTKKT